MSTRTFNQSGFEAIAVIAVLLILTAIGFTGYKVVSKGQSAQPAAMTSEVAVPATIKSSADLESTGQSLDKSDAQLDTNLNDSSLDADVKSML